MVWNIEFVEELGLGDTSWTCCSEFEMALEMNIHAAGRQAHDKRPSAEHREKSIVDHRRTGGLQSKLGQGKKL